MSGKLVMAGIAALLLPSAALAQADELEAADAQMRSAWIEACENWDDWDKPGPLFRIHANTWYVGTCGISAILIAGNEGHVLIDTGTQEGARVVAGNIEALAIDPTDIMVLLTSHEHHDHVGGLAFMQGLTGAQLVTTPVAAPALASGSPLDGDPQASIFEAFPGARVDDVLDQELTVLHGNLAIRAIPTPGHTPGATSWQWESCDTTRCLSIVYADSLSAVSADDYRYTDHPEYVAEFRESLARLMDLDCDLLLTPHPSASGMREKLLAGDLTGGMNCAEYAEMQDARLTARLAEEAQEVQVGQ